VGCYVWYNNEGTKRGPSPPRPLIAVSNVTAHPSTASVPITVLLYNGPLLCGFNVPIKGLTHVTVWIISEMTYTVLSGSILYYIISLFVLLTSAVAHCVEWVYTILHH